MKTVKATVAMKVAKVMKATKAATAMKVAKTTKTATPTKLTKPATPTKARTPSRAARSAAASRAATPAKAPQANAATPAKVPQVREAKQAMIPAGAAKPNLVTPDVLRRHGLGEVAKVAVGVTVEYQGFDLVTVERANKDGTYDLQIPGSNGAKKVPRSAFKIPGAERADKVRNTPEKKPGFLTPKSITASGVPELNTNAILAIASGGTIAGRNASSRTRLGNAGIGCAYRGASGRIVW